MERSAAAVEAEGRRCLPVVGDVRDVAAVQACVRRADQRFGRLDILVNNAGVCGITPFQEITERQWEAMLSINVTGPWNFARAALGPLSASDAGRIINTGSVATLRGLAGMAHYVASKHAVLGLTRTLAIELAPLGITANCISPGTADTELDPGLDAGLPPGEGKVRYAEAHLTGRMVEPQEISRLVAFLASPGSASITGQNFVIDGGWSA
jgi:3-oxoacyl-[acyl-carrier protein] reductase